jgi:hypothetical protein
MEANDALNTLKEAARLYKFLSHYKEYFDEDSVFECGFHSFLG